MRGWEVEDERMVGVVVMSLECEGRDDQGRVGRER